MEDYWVIPFAGVNYLCWKNKSLGERFFRPLEPDEEEGYFNSSNKEKFLHELLNG